LRRGGGLERTAAPRPGDADGAAEAARLGTYSAAGRPRLARSSASMREYTLRSLRSARMIARMICQKTNPMRMVGVTENSAFAQKSSNTSTRIRWFRYGPGG